MIGRAMALCACVVATASHVAAQSGANTSNIRHIAKFICGNPPGNFLHAGDYRTTVTIYNGSFNPAKVSVHTVALQTSKQEAVDDKAEAVVSGASASPRAKETNLPASAAISYDCERIKKILPANVDPKEPDHYGFLVVTSDRRLDVSIVHTVADPKTGAVSALAFGEATRQVGRTCTKNHEIELGKLENWRMSVDNKPRRLIASRGYDRSNGRNWLNLADAVGGEFIYELKFCVCSGSAKLERVDIRSSTASVGKLIQAGADSELWNIPQGNPAPESDARPPTKETIDGIGNSRIEARMKPAATASALSLTGRIWLADGHIGPCAD
jgi:hypothetical protein